MVAEPYSPPHQTVFQSGAKTGAEWNDPLKNPSPNLSGVSPGRSSSTQTIGEISGSTARGVGEGVLVGISEGKDVVVIVAFCEDVEHAARIMINKGSKYDLRILFPEQLVVQD